MRLFEASASTLDTFLSMVLVTPLTPEQLEARADQQFQALEDGNEEELKKLIETKGMDLDGYYWIRNCKDAACLKVLLDAGVNPNTQNGRGETVCFKAAKSDNVPFIQVLLSPTGRRVDLNMPNIFGNTPCHMAVYQKSYRSLRRLVESGANIYAVNENNETPLDIARRRHRHRCIEILEEKEQEDSLDFDATDYDSAAAATDSECDSDS